MTVLDASAVLAFLNDEPGRGAVGQRLALAECAISAVNWSEVWQKSDQYRLPATALRALSELVEIVPVDRVLAERAAALWAVASHLSLADRVCLALASERGSSAMTADRVWAEIPDIDVVLIR